jgi:hypothetical protein
MMVTANSPLSYKNAFEPTKTQIKTENNTGTFMYSGTHPRLSAWAMPYPPATPAAIDTTKPMIS